MHAKCYGHHCVKLNEINNAEDLKKFFSAFKGMKEVPVDTPAIPSVLDGICIIAKNQCAKVTKPNSKISVMDWLTLNDKYIVARWGTGSCLEAVFDTKEQAREAWEILYPEVPVKELPKTELPENKFFGFHYLFKNIILDYPNWETNLVKIKPRGMARNYIGEIEVIC